jgi:hypothetical protein
MPVLITWYILRDMDIYLEKSPMGVGGIPYPDISFTSRLIPCICACFDGKAQYHVKYTKKIQKNACNNGSIAIIYNRIDSLCGKRKIERGKEQYYVDQWDIRLH